MLPGDEKYPPPAVDFRGFLGNFTAVIPRYFVVGDDTAINRNYDYHSNCKNPNCAISLPSQPLPRTKYFTDTSRTTLTVSILEFPRFIETAVTFTAKKKLPIITVRLPGTAYRFKISVIRQRYEIIRRLRSSRGFNTLSIS